MNVILVGNARLVHVGLAHFYFHCGILHQDTGVELKDLGYARVYVVKGAGGWMDGNLVKKVSQTCPVCSS